RLERTSRTPAPTSADAIPNNCVSGRPVNGSLPFVGGDGADGGGLTNVTPNTVGVTEGLAVAVDPVVDDGLAVAVVVVVAEGLAVVVGVLVGVGLAGHALLLGLTSAKPWNVLVGDGVTRSLSGIGGGGAGATPGLAVTVTTMVSDTLVPCACASAPNESVAAPAVAALTMRVRSDARRRDREFTEDAAITG